MAQHADLPCFFQLDLSIGKEKHVSPADEEVKIFLQVNATEQATPLRLTRKQRGIKKVIHISGSGKNYLAGKLL